MRKFRLVQRVLFEGACIEGVCALLPACCCGCAGNDPVRVRLQSGALILVS